MTISMDLILKSTMVLAAAWMASVGLRRRPAALRHVVWFAALAAIGILPVLTVALPAIRVPVPDAVALAGAPVFRVTSATAPATVASAGAPAEAPTTVASPTPVVISWSRLLSLGWLVGVGLMLIQMAVGYIRMAWLRRHAVPINTPAAIEELTRAARVLGVSRDVALLESNGAGVPMATGILHPAICLPRAAREWDVERLRVVLLHEMAHIQRHDPLTHLAARFTLCLYWFHPMAWLAVREFLRERERASDDVVLQSGARPSEYAGHLLEVAVAMAPQPAGWAPVCMARQSQLEGRLVAILDARTRRGGAGPAFAAAAALAAALLVVPLAALSPQAAAVPPATAAEMDVLIRAATSARDHAMIERTMAVLIEKHKWKEAEKLADAALAIRAERYGTTSAEYGQGLAKQGEVRRAAGNWKGAEDSYTRAAALQNGGDASTLGFLARTAQSARQYEKAAGLYEQALMQHPNAKLRAQLLTSLGFVREQLQDDASAERNYLAAMQAAEPQTGEHASALEFYGRLLTRTDRSESAKPLEAAARAIRVANVKRGNQPPSIASAEPRKVGGGVEAPKLARKIEPVYSEEARASKYQGSVKLKIVVGTDGVAHDIELLSGIGFGLDEQAADAVRQWQFIPGTKDGAPVPVVATIEVNFRLL